MIVGNVKLEKCAKNRTIRKDEQSMRNAVWDNVVEINSSNRKCLRKNININFNYFLNNLRATKLGKILFACEIFYFNKSYLKTRNNKNILFVIANLQVKFYSPLASNRQTNDNL